MTPARTPEEAIARLRAAGFVVVRSRRPLAALPRPVPIPGMERAMWEVRHPGERWEDRR